MKITGAQAIVKCLEEQGVEIIFGFPGGVIIDLFDELEKSDITNVLVRHEQAAVHAADAYGRVKGEVGVALVTSGPGATNTVTGIASAYCDSIPMVVFTGQVPTALIGNDAFQEVDIVGITRPCTKHNYLVKAVTRLADTIHEAVYVATTGRPGPVVVDLPKDILFAEGPYYAPNGNEHPSYKPQVKGDESAVERAVDLLAKAKRPIFYGSGSLINAGPKASKRYAELVRLTQAPTTLTLMGLGAYPSQDRQFLGMLGMHGTYEANLAMYNCDVMINIGARFDDRVTGRIADFSPNSTKVHVDIDPSSINKNVVVDLPIIGDAATVLEQMLKVWKAKGYKANAKPLEKWWAQIETWRKRDCLAFTKDSSIIKPQHAIKRLYELTRDRDTYITTEVGQHQMWAAQYFGFEEPNRWMTSGGLGTMGYGLPAAMGVQIAHPDATVIDIAGEASYLMNIQELSTLAQYRLPVKSFIVNNQWMGMVRQWQELNHGGRYSESYSESLPDFIKVAEAFGGVGLRAETIDQLDDVIMEMLETDRFVLADIMVKKDENFFPMIPSGAAHYEMLLGPDDKAERETSENGMVLV